MNQPEAGTGPGPVLFYDSINPYAIPRRDYAALYRDGLYGLIGMTAGHLFAHRRWITITADYQHCGIIDYEPGNPCFEHPELLVAWLRGRKQMGRRARIYCDRSNLASAREYAAGWPHEWWIAAWSGPGGAGSYLWTPAELAGSIEATEHVRIDPAAIWGIQYVGGEGRRFDQSALYGTW